MTDESQQAIQVLCAWCGKEIRPGNPSESASHGICLSCMVVEGGFPVEDLHECPPAILDSLPFGVIRTTGDGRITFYSRTESSFSLLDPAHVTGKNFFRDVAPCTRVKEFAGELEEMRLHKQDGRREFAFVFRFPGRSMLVSIVMVYQAHSDVCTLLVRPVAEE